MIDFTPEELLSLRKEIAKNAQVPYEHLFPIENKVAEEIKKRNEVLKLLNSDDKEI